MKQKEKKRRRKIELIVNESKKAQSNSLVINFEASKRIILKLIFNLATHSFKLNINYQSLSIKKKRKKAIFMNKYIYIYISLYNLK